MRFQLGIAAFAISTVIVGAPSICVAQAAAEPEYLADIPWVKSPDPAALSQLYPMNLAREEKTGAAVLDCAVDAKGALTGCLVLGAAPAQFNVEKAALAVAKRLKVKAQAPDGTPTAGRRAILPVNFAPPFALKPVLGLVAGEPAFLITPDKGDLPRGEASCPTADDAARRCFLLDVTWAKSPDFRTAATIVAGIGRIEGISTADCSVAADRSVRECKMSPDLTADQVQVLTAYLAGFQADDTARGVVTAGGRIGIRFDWRQLNAAINASALKRPR